MKPTDKDKKLFRQAMKGVTPLKQGNKADTTPSKKTPKRPALPIKKRPLTPLSDGYDEPMCANSVLSFCRHGVDRKRFNSLKKGEIRPTARLDLHHKTRESAHHALDDFLHQIKSQGHRVVLIIHGKGQGIIKSKVFRWLKQFPNVLAIHSATPADGGTGAIYVYLRK